MKPAAVIVGAVAIAAAILLAGRWQIADGQGGAVYRIDRWTGQVVVCFVPVDAVPYEPAAVICP